ncbi:MAG: M4 family metallopeptidase [Verrucomicrobiales bacterium]
MATTTTTGSGTDSAGVNRTINLWRHTDNRFYMIDASKPMFDPTSSPPSVAQSRGIIAVLDLQNSTEINPAAGVHSVADAATGPWRPDAVSASNNLGRVYDYYRTRFNRNSVNGTGGTMVGMVNLNDDNAYADFQTQTMFFGNRDLYSEALDVVAHEMTHSVISTTSKLVYQFQSGALNESFSDILGEGCEAHFNNNVPDWKMGSSLRTIFRVFDNPSSLPSGLGRPYPSKFSQFEVLDISQDKGGVHINSSITNHAFYLLAQGLNGAIGLNDALQIFYRAVTTKLNPQSQFVDCRIACVTSANELFGAGSTQAVKTAEAFDRVEIFDQPARQGPAPIPAVDALDSTLFIFPSEGTMYLGRREAQFADDDAGVFLGSDGVRTPVLAGKKPVVTGNGSYGLYVRPNADASFIDTETGASTFLNIAGLIESVGLSGDGTVQAYVLRTADGEADKRIYVFDTKTNETKTYTAVQPLTNPTSDGSTNTILSVDALDLSPDGRYIYYDALNRIAFPGGGFVDTYSIYFIDRATDTISSLIPPIPGVQVGNPSLGQTRSHLITFDVIDADGLNYIYAADLAAGTLQLITLLADGTPVSPGWPGYSGDDTAIVYTNYAFDFVTLSYIPYLESQPVLADGLSPNGDAFPWLAGSNPNIGFIYRRGAFAGLPQLTVTAVDAAATEAPENPARFRVTRTGPTTQALPFSIVLSGSAQNGIDTTAIPLNHRIDAGSASVDIAVTPIDDALFEGEEMLNGSLSEALDYTVGDPRSATVTIADNDTLSFASWAASFGIGPTDFSGDADTDGRTNLMEYALGSNPKGPNTVVDPQLDLSGGELQLTVLRTRAAPDLTYIVEVSPSLGNGTWRSGPPHTTVVTDSPTLLQVVNEAASTSNQRHFIRLRVVKQ